MSFCAEVYKYLLCHCTNDQEAIRTEVSQIDANSDGQLPAATMVTDETRSIIDFMVKHWLACYMLDTKSRIHVNLSIKSLSTEKLRSYSV